LDPERVTEKFIEDVIAKNKLMWISADEYDEFTKVFLELHYDRDFLTEAAASCQKESPRRHYSPRAQLRHTDLEGIQKKLYPCEEIFRSGTKKY